MSTNRGTHHVDRRTESGQLEELLRLAPPGRRAPLFRQLRLQHRSAARYFPEPEERLLAEVADESGLSDEDSAGDVQADGG